MPEIVDSKVLDPRPRPCCVEALTNGFNPFAILVAEHPTCIRAILSFESRPVQQHSPCRLVQRNTAPLAGLGVPPFQEEQSRREIDPGPFKTQEFTCSASGVNRKPNEVGQMLGIPFQLRHFDQVIQFS